MTIRARISIPTTCTPADRRSRRSRPSSASPAPSTSGRCSPASARPCSRTAARSPNRGSARSRRISPNSPSAASTSSGSATPPARRCPRTTCSPGCGPRGKDLHHDRRALRRRGRPGRAVRRRLRVRRAGHAGRRRVLRALERDLAGQHRPVRAGRGAALPADAGAAPAGDGRGRPAQRLADRSGRQARGHLGVRGHGHVRRPGQRQAGRPAGARHPRTRPRRRHGDRPAVRGRRPRAAAMGARRPGGFGPRRRRPVRHAADRGGRRRLRGRDVAGHQGRRGDGAARLGPPGVRLPGAAAADGRAPDRDPPGPRRARRGLPGRARGAGGPAADRRADALGGKEVKARRLAVAAGIGGASIAALTLLRGRARRNRGRGPRARRLRLERLRFERLRLKRGMAAVRLVARGGARYATSAPRLFASAGEHREALRNDLALQTAEDVAATLGTMKGVLMKLGQMASYVDDGLSPAARRTLSRLQDSVPPMTPELAAQVITEELGRPPDRAFATWDPEPIAAASIGQVHRAITRDGRAVAVKVQYPGIAETVEADLGNVALLRRMLKITAPMQDVDALLAELRERVTEELDYRREARNQQMFARYYAGHPTIGVPGIVPELCTRRVVTSDLADGARFAELVTWPQAERALAAETIYRFVFRSLYGAHAFNGDPHPGNYLFHRGGRVTFLDFGLVKHFTADELGPLVAMVKHLCVDNDPEGFRRAMEDAGFLMRGAPLPTDMIVEHMAVFYDTVRERGPRTMTGAYASSVTRRFFDFRSPLAAYVQIPRSYVILQRINLGLFALLGELTATADWRCIAEEIWPFVQGPPCTPIGAAEAGWRAARTGAGHPDRLVRLFFDLFPYCRW